MNPREPTPVPLAGGNDGTDSIDLADRQVWNVPFVTDEAVSVVGEDPTQLRIDVECNGDRLAVIVDDSARVVDTERLE
ncbi:DUF7351 domain-containing protein [Natronolimnobius baerhuensis]|uniref:DUF7351 domain-containing protein n=1 Tax=Natronolimnobius baerhuensis TaxID=253108 RepID=A0A202E8H3_9EURY|nr:hypothetical protein [Natronolimnobius baerhuensis]OVE84519.1 hypothetical protein B2G88_08935 [Natronolimnobius baerhuensis]